MAVLPIIFSWRRINAADAGRWAMIPVSRGESLARRQYRENEEYPLIAQEFRSLKSHRFYFVSIKEGFDNLPETIAARFPSPEHLRKWLLIETGWHDEKDFDFEGRNAMKQAHMLGAFIRTEDSYARISIVEVAPGKVKVIIRRAKSQATEGPNAMSVEDFKASSKAVLEQLEHMIGVARGSLTKEAENHA